MAQRRSYQTIYKGKGTKGRCCNERGITLSSNMGKTFERLLNNRILTTIRITSNQAGGRKGMSTTDPGVEIRCIVIAQHKCFSPNTSDVS